MSYLSLLFPPATQGTAKSERSCASAPRFGELAQPRSPNAAESVRVDSGDGSNDYRLPSGIASLEHWLDLNA
jgi:hypothetical protein